MKNHGLILTALTIAWLALCLTGAAQVPLAEAGVARAVIVHNGHTEAADALPARYVKSGDIKAPGDELAHYLRQMTGATFDLVPSLEAAGEQPAIVLEVVEQVPGASDRETRHQAYRVTALGNRVTLTAGSELGLHYAVYGFLEDQLGCRFYGFSQKGLAYAGPAHEVVPRMPTLSVNEIDVLQEPALANRGIIYWVGSDPWVLKNRGGGARAYGPGQYLSATHNLYHLLPPRDRGDVRGLFAEHPEFYPLTAKGERKPDWAMGICGTNPDLPRFLAAGVQREIVQRQARGGFDPSIPIPAAQGDGFTGCLCGPCRALVKKEQSEAAPLILALNRTLDIVNQTTPEAQLITFAYFQTLSVPLTIKPHANLWINVVSSSRSQNAAGDQVGPIAGNPANRDYAAALQAWPQVAPGRVSVWHWDSYRAEWPSLFYVADNVRFMHQQGVYAVNPQWCGGPWVDLLAWLYLKLTWNPEADADTLIRQFLADNYGPEAGAHVWRYHRLARQAYEQSLHVPSAVRWSGWTPIMRDKVFAPDLLADMTEAMDAALAAARDSGNAAWLANLRAARGRSMDVMSLDAIAEAPTWGAVPHEADDRTWYVPGADPRAPELLMRAKWGIYDRGGGEHGVLRSLAALGAQFGGPLAELDNASVSAAVCPALQGSIVKATVTLDGEVVEVLAGDDSQGGYRDTFDGVHAEIWLPPGKVDEVVRRPNDDWSRLWSLEPRPEDTLDTVTVLSPLFWGFDASRRLQRRVALTASGLRVERRYSGKRDKPTCFTTQWRLAMPKPNQSRVAIAHGTEKQMLDLRYAVPGGIRGIKAGERLPAADNMDERFDAVIAVPDAKTTRLPISTDTGATVSITLDRGDGVAVVLDTPSAGWEAVEIMPVVDQHYLLVTLVGSPPAAGTTDELTLPVQTLAAHTVPVRAVMASTPEDAEAAVPATRIVRTGANTGINTIDGAAVTWIPAGVFQRGSSAESGGADERPQRQIELTGYWIYTYPVTLAQYKAFCEATGRVFAPTWGQGMLAEADAAAEACAVQTNWYEAEAYATWAGGGLPSEAQWEKAARGTDGREYPWGNAWDASRCVSMENTIYAFSPGFRPVGSHPQGASPYGVMDMAGNVWEWVDDWYAYDYYSRAPEIDPTGPESGSHKVLRGGCSLYDERFSRTTARMVMPPHVRDWTVTGFRCVLPATTEVIDEP